MRTWTCVVVLLASVLLPVPAAAQQEPASLTLTILAYETGEPLASAAVQVLGTPHAALSNAQGRVRIAGIPPGRHVVEVRLLGYATERLTAVFRPGESVEAELDLLLQPVALEGVDVRTERRSRQLQYSGFYQRQRMGIGTFVTREQIEERKPLYLSDAFRGIRGIALVPVSGGGYTIIITRGGVRMGLDPSSDAAIRGCPMRVYLDGIPYPLRSIDELPVTLVDAIEVYRGPAETPPQFNPTGDTCGAIVIWTR